MKKKFKNTINLINSINSFIISKNLLKPNEQILLAISGGQDSIALLVICYILKKQWNLKIIVIYCQHLWQKETLFIFLHLSKFIWTLNLNFYYSITLKIICSEQVARNWRVSSYLRILNFSTSQILVTGHTKTDQIETFFFNIIRGSGVKGGFSLQEKNNAKNYSMNSFLISKFSLLKFKDSKNKKVVIIKKNFLMSNKKIFQFKKIQIFEKQNQIKIKKQSFFLIKKISKKIFITRPLLEQSRFDIEKISNYWKLPILPDKSNKETNYSRNRIRHQVLPTLRFFFNPQIDTNLYKYNKIFSNDEKFFDNLLAQLFHEIITKNGNFFCLNLSLFFYFPLGLQKKIWFIFFQKYLLKNLNYQTLELFVKYVSEKKDNSKEMTIIWFFFPKIGIIFIFKKLIIFLK